jgi:hypothetical protein
MDNTLGWVIGAVVVALVVFAIVMGRRFTSGRIKLGKNIEGEVKGSVAPPVADENQVRGDKNKIGVQGDGASASRNKIAGKENVIDVKTK